jgi:FtsP/CotA-like multicopper oxidase with cupredoxin domain
MQHPIHLHGVWSDLEDADGGFQLRKHTIDMPPGTRRSYRVRADALGRWGAGPSIATCCTTWKPG